MQETLQLDFITINPEMLIYSFVVKLQILSAYYNRINTGISIQKLY